MILKALFEQGQTVAHSTATWQWSYGTYLRIEGLQLDPVVEVHFSLTERGGKSVTKIGLTKDNVTYVEVPKEILENETESSNYKGYAFIYESDAEQGATTREIIMSFTARPKPQEFLSPEENEMFHKVVEEINRLTKEAQAASKKAQSYAVGGTGTREGEDTDNAKHYYNETKKFAESITADGTVNYEELENKPRINGHELIGDKNPEELGLVTKEDLPKMQTTEEEEHAIYGIELISDNGWTSNGWTGNFASGFTHTAGNTTPLTFSIPNTGTKKYQIEFSCNEDFQIEDKIFVTIGNSEPYSLYGRDNINSKQGIQSVSDGDLKFIPTKDFTGKITPISVKEIIKPYPAVSSKSVTDSTGEISYENRCTQANLKNLFIGLSVGEFNTTGDGNVGLGGDALKNNTTGFWNIAIGLSALLNNTVGSRNIGIGQNCLKSNTSGRRNVGIGQYALLNNTIGQGNISLGADSMYSNTSGDNNIAMGTSSLGNNKAGHDNIAMGHLSANNNDGVCNITIGDGTMQSSTNNNRDIAIGSETMLNTRNDERMTAIGHNALTYCKDSQRNTAIGNMSMTSVLKGSFNTAVGSEALSTNLAKDVNDNVCVGFNTFRSLKIGNKNTIIGTRACQNFVSGNGNIVIGDTETVPDGDNQINIGSVYKGNRGTKTATIDGMLQINNLPSADPKIKGVLYEENGILKVSKGI